MFGTNPRVIDTDGDGLADGYEVAHRLNPLINDATDDLDLDGLTNLYEFQHNLDPSRVDSFNDGIDDYQRVHGVKNNRFYYDRNDRLVGADFANGLSIAYVYDGNGNILRQVHTRRDRNLNGLPDVWEITNGLTNNASAFTDSDGDGWSNFQEWKAGTSPTNFESRPDVLEFPGINTAPITRILPEPNAGGSLARVEIRIWDAEGNSSLPELQYFNPVSSNWVHGAILKIDGRAVTYVTATPTDSVHEVLWNVKSDLNLTSGVTTNVQLHVRAGDSTHYGNYIGDWSAPMSYTVVVPLDSDGDSIPDDWEVAHNLNPQDASDAAGDDDGDGFTNLDEYIAGTDPVNPASALRITRVQEVGNNVHLDFTAVSGKKYSVESKDSLGDLTWTQTDVFTSNTAGTQTVVEEAVVSGTTQLFYRVKCGPNGEVASEPAGYYGVALNAGPNAVSVPLHNFATARGLVDSVSGNIVTVKVNPAWTANVFAPKDGFNQYIMLVRKDASASPGIEGDWWTVASNTGNTLTLSAGTNVLSSLLGSGDQIEVRRLTSVKDLFGSGTTLILNKDSNGNAAAGDFSQADVIRFISGTAFRPSVFHHDGSILQPAGWYDANGVLNNNFPLEPGKAYIFFITAGNSVRWRQAVPYAP